MSRRLKCIRSEAIRLGASAQFVRFDAGLHQLGLAVLNATVSAHSLKGTLDSRGIGTSGPRRWPCKRNRVLLTRDRNQDQATQNSREEAPNRG